MRIGEVIGRLTLSRMHESVRGATWIIVTPLLTEGIVPPGETSPTKGREEPLVAFDQLGAGQGALIAISEGAEASAPFHPDQKPLDAYNAAILDTWDVA